MSLGLIFFLQKDLAGETYSKDCVKHDDLSLRGYMGISPCFDSWGRSLEELQRVFSDGTDESNATQSPLRSLPTLFKRPHLRAPPEGQSAGHKWGKPNYENCSGPSSALTFTIWILLTYGLTVNLNWSNPPPPFWNLVNVLLTLRRNYFRGNLRR